MSKTKTIVKKMLYTGIISSENNANKPFNTSVLRTCYRRFAAPPKRFYQKTSVLSSDGQYEVTLDQRKLKTPRGNILKVNCEPLALAVAAEWDAQKERIEQSSMHLTGLCSTTIDNPNHQTKLDIVQGIINFLETDTVLYQSSEDDELHKLQQREWGPTIAWFCKRFDISILPTRDISTQAIGAHEKAVIHRHLMSYNFAAAHGFSFAVEALKSVILTVCCVERKLSIEQAVLLSRLEEEYQLAHWGRIEWAHSLSQLDLQSRVAAAILYVHFNSVSEHITAKRTAT